MAEITKSECVAYLNLRAAQPDQRGRLPQQGTLTREQAFLTGLFNRAIEEGVLTKNPWKGIKRIPYAARERVLTEDEQRKLMVELNAEYQRFLVFALVTGMRRAGLLGITQNDVDFGPRLIRLPATPAKNGKSREIRLREEVAVAIAAQREVVQPEPDRPLWDKNGSGVDAVLRTAGRRAGVPHTTIHDLRRTFGTRCAVAGMPLPVLQRIMGHESPQVTMRYYIQIGQNDLVKAMDAVQLGIESKVAAEVVSLDDRRRQRAAGE